MADYKPPFTISAKAISMIAEISGLIERYAIQLEQQDGLKLRKVNELPGCRANAISSALGLPLRTVQRYLEQLKKQNKIEFRGAPRNGGYYPKR